MHAQNSSIHLGSDLLHTTPFYYSTNPTLFAGISDQTLALAAPIVAYWITSLFFHTLDISGWKWLDQYRIHDSAEVNSRNLATRAQVIRAVLFQQAIQTVLGIFWVSDEGGSRDYMQDISQLELSMKDLARSVLGKAWEEQLFHNAGPQVVYFTYWWGIPIAQFLFAMFVMDTWQYFLHRLMHINKFLYKHFHSVHHRLYVPYAFGALYNHPIEGFLLDSFGAALSELLSCLTTRQAALFFMFSVCKTVDDHCGYNFPLDPLQMLSGNTADYHDIHHQVVGIKSNFSQPFFIHWDVLLGTRLTRKEIEVRRQTARKKAT
ncbi:sphingosine hydroxylase [Dentipellis sp. KUC8613]|nr:sphingosine hydroxylase [Dentipellis sp. KUC8613]